MGIGDYYPYLTAEHAEAAERYKRSLLRVLCDLCGEMKRTHSAKGRHLSENSAWLAVAGL